MTRSLVKCFENVVRKGENAGCQHFLLFQQCCKNSSFRWFLNIESVGSGLD